MAPGVTFPGSGGAVFFMNGTQPPKGFPMPSINRPNVGLAGLVWLLTLVFGLSTPQAHAGPERAVVRLPSHGGSGTVIATTQNRTFILSCAHAFQGGDALKPIQIDGEQVPAGRPRLVAI